MNATSMSLVPVQSGWAVILADGRELARFTGAEAKRKALRYVATGASSRQRRRLDMVGDAAGELGGWRAARNSAGPDEDDSSAPRRR